LGVVEKEKKKIQHREALLIFERKKLKEHYKKNPQKFFPRFKNIVKKMQQREALLIFERKKLKKHYKIKLKF